MIPFAGDSQGEPGHCFSHPSFIRGNKVSSLSLERNQGQDRRKSSTMDRRSSLVSASSASSASLPSKCVSNTSLTTAESNTTTSMMEVSASSSSTVDEQSSTSFIRKCSPLPASSSSSSSSSSKIPGTIQVLSNTEEGEHQVNLVADAPTTSSSALPTPAASTRKDVPLEPLCYKPYGGAATKGEDRLPTTTSSLNDFATSIFGKNKQQQHPYFYQNNNYERFLATADMEVISLFEPRPIEQMLSEALL
jgi:hypothetical protein